MLNIIYGKIQDVIYNTSLYFKNIYDPEWLEDPKVQQMIRDIDHSEVLGSGAISSPVLGIIPPTSLSGGVKALILIDKEPGKLFNASNCGDNCAGWLLKLGEEKDITINLRHFMDFGDDTFVIRVENTGRIVHNMDELLHEAGQFV